MKNKQVIIWSVNLGLVMAAGILAWIYGPSVLVEVKYQDQLQQQALGKPVTGFSSMMYSMSGFETILQDNSLPAPLSGGFNLVIPKIFVDVSVTENVNPADVKAYQNVLREAGGVAHAAGSSVPGEPGTTYIFGHSTDSSFNVARFNAVFYLLKKLEPGDEIIANYRGQAYRYFVTEKKVVEPTDITDITNVNNQERLVLQTCWPPGTTWRRLLIIAEPKAI